MMKMTHWTTFVVPSFLVLGMVVFVPYSADSREIKKPKVSDSIDALKYLKKYGYLAEMASDSMIEEFTSAETFTKAIKEFQAYAGVNMTGQLDNDTLFVMNLPRCGVKDRVAGLSYKASKNVTYRLQGSRWKVTCLTYFISKYPFRLTKDEVDRDIRSAFDLWEDVTRLKFVERVNASHKLHIEIRFESGEDVDFFDFDGVDGDLARAFPPIDGGDVHFDDSEIWTVSSFKGTNLLYVAAHEFGHSLGLLHSLNKEALMYGMIRPYQPNLKLHQDDIKAIQSVYGKCKVSKPPAVAAPPPPAPAALKTPASSLCADPNFDTIVSMSDKNTYVFKGNMYYQLTDNGTAAGYPRSIATDFGNLESNLQAAFTWTNGKTYFFKDTRYWRFMDFAMDPGYPKEITKGFADIPSHVDAAFVWSGNGKIYFMKGTQYWRFDTTRRPRVMDTYPKLISNWEGVPNDLDGVFQYTNAYTYFFKGGSYYRFNDRAFKVAKDDPPFPRPTTSWWFGCFNKAQ